MSEDTKKKYVHFENVLNTITKKYITVPVEQKKRNTSVLEQVLDQLIEHLKKDDLFKNLYERRFYGGSYYDQLKVGKPDEFDLDMVFNLPALLGAKVEASDKPAFVKIKIADYQNLIKSKNEYLKYPKIENLMETTETMYLSVDKVLSWFDKHISKSLIELSKNSENGISYFDIKLTDGNTVKFKGEIKKAFPAFTLKLTGTYLDEDINFDVDLVPCFQFTYKEWPSSEFNYRQNPVAQNSGKNKFLVIPKKPKDEKSPYYWRLSFQEQEREMMKSNHFNVMKPAIKLLKKLRDTQNHLKISSYYIKTIFLWESQQKNVEFWQQGLSCVFMEMLKIYEEYLRKGSILYFWNDQYNLVGHLKQSTLEDIANRIKVILTQIDKNLDNPAAFAKFVLTPEELDSFEYNVPVNKKIVKSISTVEQNIEISPVKYIINNKCACSDKIEQLEKKIDILTEKINRLIEINNQKE